MEIICTLGHGIDHPGPWSDLIRINNDFTTQKLDLTGLGQVYNALWFKSGIRYYIVGDGLYEKTYKDSTIWVNLNANRRITSYYMSSISGTGLNNIIVVGAYGELLHYNGSKWKSFRNQTSLNNGGYSSVATEGGTVIAVGYDGRKAVVLMGHH